MGVIGRFRGRIPGSLRRFGATDRRRTRGRRRRWRRELSDRCLRIGIAVAAGTTGPTLGSYSFQPYDPPEVMNVEQAADFLQIDEAVVLEMAEAGKLPGRKLGAAWRFSRAALVTWLAQPEQR